MGLTPPPPVPEPVRLPLLVDFPLPGGNRPVDVELCSWFSLAAIADLAGGLRTTVALGPMLEPLELLRLAGAPRCAMLPEVAVPSGRFEGELLAESVDVAVVESGVNVLV